MSTLYPKRDTPRRKWTQPVDSTLMHKAQRENFTIFILRGILSMIRSPHVRNNIPARLRGEIEVAAMQAIMLIKDEQRIRMMGRWPQ